MTVSEIMTVLSALAVNIVGWLGTAGSDGKLDKYDWKKLAGSQLRILVTGVGLAGTFALWGVDVNIFTGMAGGTLVEYGYLLYKRFKKVP